MKSLFWLVVASGCLGGDTWHSALAAPTQAPRADTPMPRLWKPVPDEVYWQEAGQKIATAKPVTALAVHAGAVYVVEGGKVKKLTGETLQEISSAPEDIQ